MANPKNLVRNESRTPRQRRENARKAGKASAEARRKRRSFRETIEAVLSLPAAKDIQAKIKSVYPAMRDEDITVQVAAICNVIAIISKGGAAAVMAFKEIRDSIGEKPIDKIQPVAPVQIIDDV